MGAGLGYKFFNRDDFKLAIRLGPSWVNESFSDETSDESKATALFTWDLTRMLATNWEFFNNIQVLQSLEDADDELVKLKTGVRTDLTRHIFLEGKILWEWDNAPAKDTNRQDVDYIFGVGYKF